MKPRAPQTIERVGRYVVFEPIASGGMATLHLGRLIGPAGFTKTVAVKRLHSYLAKDPTFVNMFLDEARVASRVQHANVAATLDITSEDGSLHLILEYVHGATLAELLRAACARGEPVPVPVAIGMMLGMLAGLHAVHEAKDRHGVPLAIVHRDISPQNVLIGSDGVTKVVDFGVAKSAARVQATGVGEMKGKLSYMAPEQMRRADVDRRTDIFAAGVVLWELLTSTKLFVADDVQGLAMTMLMGEIPPPSQRRPELTPAIDAVVLRALAREPGERFQDANAMAIALEAAVPAANARAISEWVNGLVGGTLEARAALVARAEDLDLSTLTDAHEGLLTPSSKIRLSDEPTLVPAVNTPVRVVATAEGSSTPPRSRRRLTLSIGAVAVAATIVFAVVAGRGRAAPAQSSTPTGPSSLPVPSSATSVSMPAASDAAAMQDAPHAISSGKTSSAPTPRPPAATHSTRPRPAKADLCNPPYTLDATGIKRFKPHCI